MAHPHADIRSHEQRKAEEASSALRVLRKAMRGIEKMTTEKGVGVNSLDIPLPPGFA